MPSESDITPEEGNRVPVRPVDPKSLNVQPLQPERKRMWFENVFPECKEEE